MSSCSHNSSAKRQQNDIPPRRSQKPTASSWYPRKYLFLGLLGEAREAVLEGLAMLIRSMFGETMGKTMLALLDQYKSRVLDSSLSKWVDIELQ